MNIETANHLVQLRKKHGFSQESLAEKLGLSRQAVSKWERAEASPDTDNLIALAKLYDMSLDELLLMKDEENSEGAEGGAEEKAEAKKPQVSIGLKGVHVVDGNSEVHVGPGGVYVKENGEEKVDINGGHINVAGETPKSPWVTMPCPFIITAVFLAIGFATGAWHPAWLVFFLIPLYYTLVEAISKRSPNLFAFPVLMAALYLCAGIFFGWWAWGWIVFLAIPVYYCIFPGKKDKE